MNDNPITLADGGKKAEFWKDTSLENASVSQYNVALSGNTLTFSGKMGNRSSIIYKWVAIY